MAQVTNVKQYTISDINRTNTIYLGDLDPLNNASRNGQKVEAYPSKIVPSDNLVSRSWNNMYAQFIDKPVNLKLKVNWIFDVVSKKAAEIIMTFIRNQIINNHTREFIITTAFPGYGDSFIEMQAYLGTPTNFESLDWMTDCGDVNYYKLELHWIETKGRVLIAQS